MFKKIMVPVDLEHKERLSQALTVASDLARQYGSTVVYVGVTTNTPSSVAHTPKEYQGKLEAFAQSQGGEAGIETAAQALVSHDPSSDLDSLLLDAVKETGADLVVMQSHVPNVMDYVWASHGGHLAEHAKASVMLIR